LPFINQEIAFGDFRLYKSAIERLKGVNIHWYKPLILMKNKSYKDAYVIKIK
jgi:hypothetical protein